MSARNDGGPAFPGGVNSVYTDIDAGQPTQAGMSLRDYFAAKALQSAIITDTVPGAACDAMIAEAVRNGREPEDQMAMSAYAFADAMLRAREAKP